MCLYVTAGTGQLSVVILKALRTVVQALPDKYFTLLHAFFVLMIFEFGIQPPVEPQDAKFISSYK